MSKVYNFDLLKKKFSLVKKGSALFTAFAMAVTLSACSNSKSSDNSDWWSSSKIDLPAKPNVPKIKDLPFNGSTNAVDDEIICNFRTLDIEVIKEKTLQLKR